MPTPTRGRFVEFTPSDKNPVFLAYDKVPFVAQIVHVHKDGKHVNLMVFYPNGDMKPEISVPLLDGTETELELKSLNRAGRFAKWPAHMTTKSEVKVELSVDTTAVEKDIARAMAQIDAVEAAKKAAGI